MVGKADIDGITTAEQLFATPAVGTAIFACFGADHAVGRLNTVAAVTVVCFLAGRSKVTWACCVFFWHEGVDGWGCVLDIGRCVVRWFDIFG